jgi:DNA-binding CsgD family transcriptional regulator
VSVLDVREVVDRRHGLSVVTSEMPAAAQSPDFGRRWDDRPGELATMTFAHLLTSRPSIQESLRLAVSMLCWPVGAQGAMLVRRDKAGRRVVARYVDQVSAWPDDLAAGEVPSAVAEIVAAAIGPHPVLWTQPDGSDRAPMAAWVLGSPSEPVGVLVIFLSTPLEPRLVTMRANSIAEILGLYLAGLGGDVRPDAGRVPPAEQLPEALTSRQEQILRMMAHELTNPQIASRIGFSTSTVRMESLAIYRALGVHDRQHAVIAGRALGLLDSV